MWKKVLKGMMGAGVVFFALHLHASTFTASIPQEPAVVMDAPSAEVTIRITHTGTTRPIYRIRFYFNAGVYCPSMASTGAEGWSPSWNDCSTSVSGIEFVTSTNPINPRQSADFTIVLQGPGYIKIPRSNQDQLDSTTQIRAWDNNEARLTYQGSQPSWIRHGLDGQTFAFPPSVGVGGEITVQFWIKNTSTAIQSLIIPSPPNIYGDGSAVLKSGPYPSSVTLSPLEEAIFEWRYTASSPGVVWFDSYAGNGIVSTVNPFYLLSPHITIGDFTCSIEITPEEIGSEMNFNVKMTVYNNSSQNLGLVQPSALSISGTATATLVSGPTPDLISQLPPSSSGSFEWIYKIEGNPGDYLSLSGYATAYQQGISTPVCESNVIEIVKYPMIVMPDSVTSGATDARFAYIFRNGGTVPINRIYIQHNVNYEGTWIYQTGSGSGGYAGCNWTRTEYTDWVRFDSPNSSCNIPPAGQGIFYLTYSRVPTVDVETRYTHKGNVFNGGTLLAVTTYDVTVVPYSLTLSKDPSGPVPADGTSRYDITALLMNGPNPVSGAVVNFSTTAGTLTSSTAETDEKGIASVQLIAPSSPYDITAVVSASYRNASSSITAPFTGVKVANLQYIGGTLYPASMAKGGIYSIRADFINAGNLSITLNTNSYVTFSDGLNIYTANLQSGITINPDERVTLYFNEESLNENFSSGIYYPHFYLTDGSIVQERDSFDGITVISKPEIISVEGVPNPGEVYLTFNTEAGENYEILFKDSFTGSFSLADSIYADGTTYTWIDDGSKTGSLPYSVKERYYEIRHSSTGIPSTGWGGSYCIDVWPNWTFISLPIVPDNTSIQVVIGNQLTGGAIPPLADKVWKWNPSSQSYEIAWLHASGVWRDAATGGVSNMNIDADRGFWIDARNRGNMQKFCFGGKVSLFNRIMPISGRPWNNTGSSYPLSVTINGSNLYESGASGGAIPPLADKVWKWNPSSQSYEIAWLHTSGVWRDAATGGISNMLFEPGYGMWFEDKPPQGFTWNYPKPYTIPPNE